MLPQLSTNYDFIITKLDQEQRIVHAIATDESKDKQKDIIDYDASKEAFALAKDTMGVREMHDEKKAVGRLEAYYANDGTRTIEVDLYLSKSRDGEDTLTKVKEGVLKGVSIAGRVDPNYVEYDLQKGARVIKKLSLTEISLVDVPANPHAQITLVKAEGGIIEQTVENPSAAPAIVNNYNGGTDAMLELQKRIDALAGK